MLPLRDNIPARRPPVVTVSLIIVNAAAFLHLWSQGDRRFERAVWALGFVPARLYAAIHDPGTDPGVWLTSLSSMFLHGGWLHLLANMWMLWIFGDNVEDRLGRGRYLVFYLACGLAAVAAQYLARPLAPVPLVGASGAIAGVLGAYLLLFPRARILTLVPIFIFFYFVELPAVLFLGLWLLVQFLNGTAQMTAGAPA
ncbi:MAG: rhomboid family intramembrane serine protease, partial [Thermodesulfobacteriota bacterium]